MAAETSTNIATSWCQTATCPTAFVSWIDIIVISYFLLITATVIAKSLRMLSVECRVSALTVAFMPLSGNGFATSLLHCAPEQSKRSQCLLLPHSPPSHKKPSFCRQQKFYIGLIIEQVLVSVGNKILFYSEGRIFVATVIALASLELSIKSRKCLPALYTLYF